VVGDAGFEPATSTVCKRHKKKKKRLNEATKQVILKVRDGHLVKKHNIWYGFFRNLVGGSIYSSFFCFLTSLNAFKLSLSLTRSSATLT